MKLKNQAFSTTELLVTFTIASILVLMGTKAYNEQKKNSNIRITQSEMIEVLRYAKMAKTTDGAYHQFLYQMGYTPKGEVIAIIGTGASDTNHCCHKRNKKYPRLGSSPCSTIGSANNYTINKGETCIEGFRCITGCKFGRCESSTCTCRGVQAVKNYSYYNCKNDPINKATDNVKICKAYPSNDLDLKCDTTDITSTFSTFPSFTKCKPTPSRWCSCKKFTVGAQSTKFDEELTLNQDNEFCAE